MPDFLLTVSGLGFAMALLPAVRQAWTGRTTITLWSSVPTAVLLGVTATALIMLEQWYGAFSTMLTAGLWTVLAITRILREDV